MEAWKAALTDALSPGHPARGIIMAVLTLVALSIVQRHLRRKLQDGIKHRAAEPGDSTAAFLRIYGGVWFCVKAVLVLIAATGSFRLLGLTVGLLGTMLGWSLQVPIRGLAAWVMVILKHPFRIGDRITVAGVTGDVIDIQLNHILLNQVGGTVQGEERSGRGILVPNAMLFSETLLNYNYLGRQADAVGTPASKSVLDEVLVRVSFSSDHASARDLCIAAAREALGSLGIAEERPPFVRSELLPWGVLLRVRYMTLPARRQETSSRVTECIWSSFRAHPDGVAFAYPGQVAKVVRHGHVPLPAPSA